MRGSGDSLFDEARRVHAAAQGGGSGVDVAAAVFGGALEYTLSAGGPQTRPVRLPPGLHWTAYWSGSSARTSDLLARVRELRCRDGACWATNQALLKEAALVAARATSTQDFSLFLEAARMQLEGLRRLGEDSGAPIVPPAFVQLAARAASEGGVFVPSGAGGGDIGLPWGPPRAKPSTAQAERQHGVPRPRHGPGGRVPRKPRRDRRGPLGQLSSMKPPGQQRCTAVRAPAAWMSPGQARSSSEQARALAVTAPGRLARNPAPFSWLLLQAGRLESIATD